MAFEEPVRAGELTDPFDQRLIAELVELLLHACSQPVPFVAAGLDLLAGHGEVGLEAG